MDSASIVSLYYFFAQVWQECQIAKRVPLWTKSRSVGTAHYLPCSNFVLPAGGIFILDVCASRRLVSAGERALGAKKTMRVRDENWHRPLPCQIPY